MSFACGSFEDQFEDFAGQNTLEEITFEVPFDLFLIRASISTIASTAADAYARVIKDKGLGSEVIIVDAGPVPPSRNLPAVTGQTTGVDVVVFLQKGDLITVELNLVLTNTIKRAKYVLGYVCPLLFVDTSTEILIP